MGNELDSKTFWIISVLKNQLIMVKLMSNCWLGDVGFHPIQRWPQPTRHMTCRASVSLNINNSVALAKTHIPWVKEEKRMQEGDKLRENLKMHMVANGTCALWVNSKKSSPIIKRFPPFYLDAVCTVLLVLAIMFDTPAIFQSLEHEC